jgi:hypothetical protein
MYKVIFPPISQEMGASEQSHPVSRWQKSASLLVLGLAVLLLFLSAPYKADIWWSDASRHAMDGVFYRDLFRTLPLGHMKQYAMNYYLQYPALAILFYPPLFALVEAVFFQIFGISLFSAQLTVAVFYLSAAWGAYFLSRRWLGHLSALAVSLLFIGLPEVALWGRQVMLEIPACAFLKWSAVVFFRYLDQSKPQSLYLVVVLLAAGAYTKQTVLFILPVFLWMLWSENGRAILKDRHFWAGAALLTALMTPLAILNLTITRYNVDSVLGGEWAPFPVFSWQGWTYYLRQFPSQTTRPVVLLSSAALVLGVLRPGWWGQGEKYFAGWLVGGYIFFSLIALKEPRHSVLILLPLAFFSVRCIQSISAMPARATSVLAVVFAGATFGHTLLRDEVPRMYGYREAADYVAGRAPQGSVILFSGYRDGAFIFDLRSRIDRRDLSTLRSDKLLLRVRQRWLAADELKLTGAETGEMLNHYGVKYVVSQPNFWGDLKNLQMLQGVLHSPQFRLVATIPITSNVNHEDQQIEIYENLEPINKTGRQRIRLELPIIGQTAEGTLGPVE